jgi:hypothetical protein
MIVGRTGGLTLKVAVALILHTPECKNAALLSRSDGANSQTA